MHAYLIMHMSNPSQFPGEGVAGAFLGASMKWFAYIAVCVLLVQTVCAQCTFPNSHSRHQLVGEQCGPGLVERRERGRARHVAGERRLLECADDECIVGAPAAYVSIFF